MVLRHKKSRSYQGCRALVTGGASGLGLELTKLLVADGASVVVGDLTAERPESVPEGIEYVQLDVRDEAAWLAVRRWVDQRWGRLDLLVNNAGIAVGGRIDATAATDWERAVSVNVMGVVNGSRTFVPMMKQQHSGQIINTASLAGLVHAPGMAAYNATKAAVVAISETMRSELAPFGIEVGVICPSFFRTNLATSLAGHDAEMETAAVDLINRAPRSAPQVATAAFAGMAQGRHVILTDSDGRVAHAAKRFARPLYDRAMARAGQRIQKGASPEPAHLVALKRATSRG